MRGPGPALAGAGGCVISSAIGGEAEGCVMNECRGLLCLETEYGGGPSIRLL